MSLPEKVVQIPITRLRAFPEHPFYVRDDDMMQQLVESVRQVGVLMPIIVRGSEDGFYEIIPTACFRSTVLRMILLGRTNTRKYCQHWRKAEPL